jgi:hypothetical protein
MGISDGSSFSDIFASFQRDLVDFTSETGRQRLIECLALLSYEIQKINTRQRVYAAALRAQGVSLPPSLSNLIDHMPRQAVIDARDSLDAIDGFYPLEYGADAAYRWTGPGREVSFRAWVDRSGPTILEVALYSFGDPRNHDSIQLRVDGEPVRVISGEKVIRSDPIHIRSTNGPTEIRLDIPFSFCPKDQGESDSRELRIAFSKLTLTSAVLEPHELPQSSVL